jgi:hypothetical protein
MRPSKLVRSLILGVLVPIVAAGPGGYVTLINGSPFDWKLTYSHAYQMDWKPAEIIRAGESHEQYLEYWYHWGDNGDDAAEATYELVGSPVPASFQLQARQDGGKHLQVQYHGGLSSLNNPQNSLIQLDFVKDGGVSFILSGDGLEPYISTNPPTAWMQATYSTIGSSTLRQITMPASHDSGMSEVTTTWWGTAHSTNTQSVNIYQQLMNGARWFDIRPVHTKNGWYTGHFSEAPILQVVGAMGRGIRDIVADINKFNAENPGELIILDMTHEMDWTEHGKNIWKITSEQWQYLYEVLGDISNLWTVSNIPQDYTSVPISTFIQPGSKSAVLIRVPGYAPSPVQIVSQKRKLPSSAFVHEGLIPYDGSYSNTDQPETIVRDQLNKLQILRNTPETNMQRSTWTITVGIKASLDIANWFNSIIGRAIPAHRMLYAKLWPALSKSSYPNLIELDDIHNTQPLALAMGITKAFAPNNAPVIGGKERQPPPQQISTVTITPTATATSVPSMISMSQLPILTPAGRTIKIKGRAVEMPK